MSCSTFEKIDMQKHLKLRTFLSNSRHRYRAHSTEMFKTTQPVMQPVLNMQTCRRCIIVMLV